MTQHSRRDVLKAAGVATGIGLSGYGLSTLDDGTVRAAETEATPYWPMARQNAQGTSHNVEAVSPVNEFETAWAWEADQHGLQSTPVVSEDTVYVVEHEFDMENGRITLRALDEEDGSERWSVTTEGYTQSPAVAGDLVYLQTQLETQALNVEDGAVVWKREDIGNRRVSPTIVGDTLYVNNSGTIVALDRKTGETEQKFELGTEKSVRSDPVVANGTLYAGTYNTLYAVDIETGSTQWSVETTNEIETIAVSNETVYYTDSRLVAVDTSGTQRWTNTDVGGEFAVGGEHIFAMGSDSTNEAALVAIDRESGEEVWSFDTLNEIHATPSVANGAVYVTGMIDSIRRYQDHLHLFVLDAQTGIQHSHVERGDNEWFAEQALPVDGRVYFGAFTISGSEKENFLWALDGPVAENNHAIEIDSTPDLDSTDFDEGDSVALDASGSVDPNGEIVEFEWDTTGDGNYDETGPQIQMDLSFCGVQDVTVKTTDDEGDTTTKTIQVDTT
ncbi:PQQ-binding-like beta-propeller repeat protein [Haladaptatus sp. GCM10025707]|uniref:PQQ-like beta-propeller repeat protein n=1 Tax=unclassified Haladaptatus TaxID=2622732 RepID=UPI0023E86927|nr:MULTISPECIES: PQQ-like beta-propeller repeat protein [unclassified Haladaptatus]